MTIEKNYLRRSYRINLPAKVKINNKIYNVKDWSFLGFRIEFEESDIKINEIYPITFELPFVNFDMSFNAKAVCKWKKEHEAGFEFEELSDDIKLLMKEYVEAFVEGRLQEENGLLKIANGLEIPISTDLPITDEEEQFLNKKLIKNTFLVVLFIGIAAIIGYIIYLNRHSVYSEEAFISGKTFYIKSPVNGIIQNLYIKPLQKIKKNQTIALINNSEIQTQIKNIDKNIKMYKKEIKNLKNILIKEKRNIDLTYNNALKEKYIKLNSLKKELKIQLSLIKELKKEYKIGIIHISQIETLKNNIINIKNEINFLNQKNITKNYNALIPIKNLLLSQKNNLIKLENTLKILYIQQQNFIIKSPVNGKILSIYVKPKSFITKNSLISTIEINTKGYVIARYTFRDAPKISIGDSAQIYIPAINKTFNGIVTAIGKNALKSNSVFTESNVYSQKDVPVKIKILEPNHLEDGIFAQVEIDVK